MDKAHILTKRWIPLAIPIVLFCGGVIFYVHHSIVTCAWPESGEYFMLPSSARDIQRHCVGATRSYTHWVRFQMDPTDLEPFLKSTFIEMPLSSSTLPQGLGSLGRLLDKAGWAVNTNIPYLAGGGEKLLDKQIIFIDASSQDQYIVYLVTKKNWL
jgi:hypothetical protein